jgi:hypothetical protein
MISRITSTGSLPIQVLSLIVVLTLSPGSSGAQTAGS